MNDRTHRWAPQRRPGLIARWRAARLVADLMAPAKVQASHDGRLVARG